VPTVPTIPQEVPAPLAMSIRTRFAPSPTGMLHIGGVRTALFSWLFARHHGGEFILRVEDTDRERSTDEAVQVILDGMDWLELRHDDGPYYQTRRMERYREVIGQFLREGKAYHCYCSKEELEAMRSRQFAAKEKPRYDGTCRHRTAPVEGVQPVVRFKNPVDGTVVVNDVVHGPVAFANAELDDLIIARSDGTPTYNFCVVVDDWDMKITHVIRGDDHLNNTPRQINMLTALGAHPPVYAHVAMILGADGAKLSKRHGAVSVLQYREEGYLPEALLNYLVRLGWSHGDQEIFSMDEMVAHFDLAQVNKSASAFDPDKLLWVNQQHLMKATPERIARFLRPQLGALGVNDPDEGLLLAVAKAQQGRVKTLKEMAEVSLYFFRDVVFDEKAVAKHLTGEALAALEALYAGLEGDFGWQAPTLHGVVSGVATGLGVGLGKVAQPLRVAVTGGTASPPIDVTLEVLGKERVLSRLKTAINLAARPA
jgi:glutamyl-tRNA synthetase